MIRWYNWWFTHNSLLDLSLRQFLLYYEQLWICIWIENWKKISEIENKDKPDIQKIKKVLK